MNFARIRNLFGSSLKNKIILIITLVAVIPFSGIYLYMFFSLKADISDQYIEDSRESLGKISELLDRKLLEYAPKAKYVALNRNITENMGRDFGDDIDRKASFYLEASELLSSMAINDSSSRIRYTIYYDNKSLFEYKNFKAIENMDNLSFIKNYVLKGIGSAVVWSPTITNGSMGEKYVTLYMNIPILSMSPCVLEICIPYSDIEIFLNSIETFENSIVLYVDASGVIVNSLSTGTGKQSAVQDLVTGNEYILIEKSLVNLHKIVVAIPRAKITHRFVSTYATMLFIFFVVIASIYMVANLTTNSITKALKEFLVQIKKDDDLLLNNVSIEVSGTDEISVIKGKFGELVRKINALHKENLEAFKNRKVLEMELLQSKLNPHLLYNSLSVVKWKAMMNGDKPSVELVDCMTKYYRAVLNRGTNIIQIRDELNLIRDYVKINEFSHAAVYGLEIDVPVEIQGFYTIKLILQPIIENAILHGLNGKEGNKKIVIKGFRMENDIVLQVADNGYGMSRETVESVLSQEFRKRLGGYGIKNLLNRLKTYFGEGYSVEIESQPGCFTRVSVRIPVLDNAEMLERLVGETD